MYRHILVPLDGSHLAESVLPVVRNLARKINARVTLIHIIEEDAPENIHGDHHIKTDKEACQYLEQVAGQLRTVGIDTQTHVHTTCVADLAESIVEHATEFDHDLIVLCTHGEEGWKDRMVGSIAQQVIGMGRLPVLLLQPQGEDETPPPEKIFQKFLLALDGKEDHEAGVEKSIELAAALKAGLHLLTVVETFSSLRGSEAAMGMLLPAATTAMLDIAEEDAKDRLLEKAEYLQKKGFPVSLDVHRGDPVQWIIKDANSHQCDLIVLGTHGKSGMKAFWAGSSAPKIPELTRIPLLLIPVHHS
ncbi:MAG: universal stress protein [Leptolinea sp.]|jgi:nucleotide-binding universal stress UspA family protein|nr:universal stress protein [Leptolinea sp.]